MDNKNDRLTFVLVHGACTSGASWDGVAEHLRASGHDVHTPTLAGCGPDARADATLDDAVSSLADYITSHDLNGVTLLGFSLGGVMVTQAAPLVADRLARVVFHSAVVLRTGESVFDTVPPKMGQHLRSLTNKGMLTMPHAMFRDRIAAEEDAATAQALYDTHSYPHAVSMFDTSVDARAFENLLAEGLPVSWVEAPNDVLLGFGRWRWSRFANRLGTPRVIHLPACGHDAPLTHPEATAYAYHKAARA